MEVFLHPSILQTDCSKFLLKDNFGPDSGSRPQIISAPPAPAPAQHCLIKCIFKIKEQDLDSMHGAVCKDPDLHQNNPGPQDWLKKIINLHE